MIPPTSFLWIIRCGANVPVVVRRSTLDQTKIINLSSPHQSWVVTKRTIIPPRHAREILFVNAFFISSRSIFVFRLSGRDLKGANIDEDKANQVKEHSAIRLVHSFSLSTCIQCILFHHRGEKSLIKYFSDADDKSIHHVWFDSANRVSHVLRGRNERTLYWLRWAESYYFRERETEEGRQTPSYSVRMFIPKSDRGSPRKCTRRVTASAKFSSTRDVPCSCYLGISVGCHCQINHLQTSSDRWLISALVIVTQSISVTLTHSAVS